MSGEYEKLGRSTAKSANSIELRLAQRLSIYTFGIFYILCSGLINFHAPSEELIAEYGIDKVSGFYGPGSWAAWLLTTMACCIDQLFNRRPRVDLPQGRLLNSKSGMNINLIAVYSYPLIAGVDLLWRSSQHDFSKEASSIEIGCIAASLTVLRMGAGLGTLLSIFCIRRQVIHPTSLVSVILTIAASSTLFIMSLTFDIILIGFRAKDFALNLFGLPGPNFQLETPNSGLAALLQTSNLVGEQARLPRLALYFIGGDMAIAPRIILSFLSIFTPVSLLFTYGASWGLVPRTLVTVFIVYLGMALLFTLSTFFVTFFGWYFWTGTDIPITIARLGDLDQLSVLCLSGVLIVVSTLMKLVPGCGRMKR
ncbi:hypothetical protein ONS95_011869 [Cadophora gregata]|uniref:uncharacterized protein n=1 Tax=Cadophora gregata TaxID=51156 RepID=UPI0026DAB603|nr:uncharacterized protein ONS95_011869 [Cadophora gregata]KAK0117529.1 hypothetical protein ONS95_011869 [Cadophora gregata]KAK0122582.1 hypothetical protein ONS96_009623 [Cadophora gregata f. sp. sojae]